MFEFIEAHDNVFTNKGFSELKGKLKNGAKTLLEGLIKNSEVMPDKKVHGTIIDDKLDYKTYKEIQIDCKRLGAFLETITVEREIIGIYSINRIEWTISEYATYFANCINCPLFSNFTEESLRHVLSETEMKTIICASNQLSFLIKSIKSSDLTFKLKNIILMDDEKNLKELVEEAGYNFYLFSDILSNSSLNLSRPHPLPNDLATICYTSGASGLPKGAMLTHANFISQVEGFELGSEKYGIINFNCDEIYISYLPLAHVLERIVFTIVFFKGGYIGYFSGNLKALQNDFKIIKPTFITVVPRVLNVFKSKIEEKVNNLSFIKRAIFKIGLSWKLFMLKFGYVSSWFWDSLVFNKISSEFGGAINGSLCGGAAINPDVINFMKVVLSAKIFQGYGQTEGIGANIVSPIISKDVSSVGVPFVTTQIKLVYSDDLPPSCGHLYMRGPCIMQGYYKREDLTKKAFDKGGWLITGDICKYENGMFYVVGRSKDLFKTSFGEYITPEVIENLLSGGIVEDIYVTYSLGHDYLLAIVVCSDENVSILDVANKIKERGSHLVSEKKMARYEIPAHFVLVREPFISINDGKLITPSLKKRRREFESFFESKIKAGFAKMM